MLCRKSSTTLLSIRKASETALNTTSQPANLIKITKDVALGDRHQQTRPALFSANSSSLKIQKTFSDIQQKKDRNEEKLCEF